MMLGAFYPQECGPLLVRRNVFCFLFPQSSPRELLHIVGSTPASIPHYYSIIVVELFEGEALNCARRAHILLYQCGTEFDMTNHGEQVSR